MYVSQPALGFRVRIQGLGVYVSNHRQLRAPRDWKIRFRGQGLGFRVQGLGLRVQVLGFKVGGSPHHWQLRASRGWRRRSGSRWRAAASNSRMGHSMAWLMRCARGVTLSTSSSRSMLRCHTIHVPNTMHIPYTNTLATHTHQQHISKTLATHQQHLSKTLATHQHKISKPFAIHQPYISNTLATHISNTLATHQQHISNTLLTHY